jgi:aspartyl-tRNA(Asn)/glutamyl-tRNA(Gln) amidotransferase subunit B
MQEGSFRCDANVSVRRPGAALGKRCEIKNLNSFRFREKAIEFEVKRQIEILEDGGKIVQETRLYDSDKDETRSMRSKEDAQDYRYFPDPDLLPLEVSDKWIEEIRASLPELPEAKRKRYNSEFSLSSIVATQLIASRDKAEFFERSVGAAHVIQFPAAPQDIAFNVVGELAGILNDEGLEFSQIRITAEQFAKLRARVLDGSISNKSAKEVLTEMWDSKSDPDAIIAAKGLTQLSDSGAIEKIVDDVLAANAKQVEDYRAGKDKAFNSLVGQVMKATKGKANPAQVNEILKRKLGR